MKQKICDSLFFIINLLFKNLKICLKKKNICLATARVEKGVNIYIFLLSKVLNMICFSLKKKLRKHLQIYYYYFE